jgi:hypothetical protein
LIEAGWTPSTPIATSGSFVEAARDRGYRDVLVNLHSVPDGLVTEVQFHIKAFFNRQHGGPHHKKYELIRFSTIRVHIVLTFDRKIKERTERAFDKLKG